MGMVNADTLESACTVTSPPSKSREARHSNLRQCAPSANLTGGAFNEGKQAMPLILHVRTSGSDRMRNVLPVAIVAVSTTAILAPSSPAQAQYQQCIKGRGCVPASQRSYNACFNL